MQLPMRVTHHSHRCAILVRINLRSIPEVDDHLRTEASSPFIAVVGDMRLTSTTVGSCLRCTHAPSKSFTAVSAGNTSLTASTPCHEASTSFFPRYFAQSTVTCNVMCELTQAPADICLKSD